MLNNKSVDSFFSENYDSGIVAYQRFFEMQKLYGKFNCPEIDFESFYSSYFITIFNLTTGLDCSNGYVLQPLKVGKLKVCIKI